MKMVKVSLNKQHLKLDHSLSFISIISCLTKITSTTGKAHDNKSYSMYTT